MKLKIFTQTQAQYTYELIQHRTNESLSLDQWFMQAKVTIEVLVANMVNPDMMNHIFFQHYKQVNEENVQKLLKRVD